MKTKPTQKTFSLLAASEHMGVARETMRRRFRRVGIEPTEGRRYTLEELFQASDNSPTAPDGSDGDPFRMFSEMGATYALFDSWAVMGDVLRDLAKDHGLTGAEFEKFAVKAFFALAMRTA